MSIHPSSRLGKLEAQLETARAAHQATTDHLATLQSEAGDLDRWIEAAGLDTAALEFAKKHARRMIVANVMARARVELASQQQTLAELEKQSRPMHETYERVASTLAQMDDPSSELVRTSLPYMLEREKKELTLWMEEWTEPEAPAVDALELQEV
jgi:uncharacterized membrane protein YccC